MAHSNPYDITKEDTQRLAQLTGFDITFREADEAGANDPWGAAELDPRGGASADMPAPAPIDPTTLIQEMSYAALSTRPDDEVFFHFFQANKEHIAEAAWEDDRVGEALLLCFKFAICAGSASCMNCLGAMYYMGEFVGQDYACAAELYEMAMDAGCYQSIINLGYIYEYGRTGAPDYGKAYQYYALAMALEPSCEAAYKLGDMYSRGKSVERNLKRAHILYERSLSLATCDEEFAQPAVRIAKMLIDPQGPGYGVEANPLRALSLYQRAEVGLRKDIANGMVYYRKRLAEAIEGQATARSMLDGPADVIDFK